MFASGSVKSTSRTNCLCADGTTCIRPVAPFGPLAFSRKRDSMEMMESSNAGGSEYFDADDMTAAAICSAFSRAKPNFCERIREI